MNHMHNKFELGRTTSCFGDEQESALDALLRRDHQFLSDLLNNGGVNLEKNYPQEQQKNLLSIAVDNRDIESLRLILASGANVNAINPLLKTVPIHIAIRKSQPEILRILLLNNADPNIKTADGKTPLHLAIKSMEKVDNEGYACIKTLLREGSKKLSIDAEDSLGQSPLSAFVSSLNANPTNRDIEIITLFLKSGADSKAKVVNDSRTLAEIIENFHDSELNALVRKNKAEFHPLSSNRVQEGILKDVYDILNKADFSNEAEKSRLLKKFKTTLGYLKDEQITASPPSGVLSPLQRACELGLVDFVQVLLDKGHNPNVHSSGTTPAVILASKSARSNVLKLLAEHGKTDFGANKDGETVLHAILRKPYSGSLSEVMDYETAWETLVEIRSEYPTINHELSSVINSTDELLNTPLHYATQCWPQKVVRSLLELGSNIGMKNSYGEIPVDRILSETLEDFFSSYCLEHEGNIANEDLRITVKYDFLAPPVHDKAEGEELLPETDVLWHMSQNSNHRRLLKHPVITSFLWMKWKRISGSYNKNLLFYFLYVLFLTWFIFAQFAGKSIRSNSLIKENCPEINNTDSFIKENCSEINNTDGFIKENCHEINNTDGFILFDNRPSMPFDVKVLWYIVAVMSGMLAFRELLQFGVAPRRYVFSPENWIEIAVVGLAVTLLSAGAYGCNISLKRHAAAIVIVLSWSEMVTMIGRHPKLSTYNIYVIMFYRVLWTFIVFLIWYSMFIIAFGLGFYILLHDDDGSSSLENKEYPFFDYLGLTLVKTFTMFVGELEFSDLPISTPVGYLFLISFVFLIVVVMMNLLNGLAVSDTGVIREEAEIHSIVSQVDVISYLEAMLLGDPFNFLSNWPTFVWLRNFPDCNLGSRIYKVPALRTLFQKITGGPKILLFYDRLPDKRVSFYPNRDDFRCYYCCCCSSSSNQSEVHFHPSISSSAKCIISDNIKEKNNMESRIDSIEDTLLIIKKNQLELSSKLDNILEMRRY
ncbi:transient receptor potential cation channel subfamily A member 1 homolog [Lepeophtheirus salmonis]|uniref:transient receptor potential cation channel subfamily A member 1 homolog n=1 Tax=Lepeophtheirus salmonis TaxID=72036 RepID=UPI001AEA7EC9|nr:transient receptor potential channel pyrexia-like [Lepeophtheirus salmonis]